MPTLDYNVNGGILANSFAEFQPFYFFTSKFMRSIIAYSAERAVRFSGVPFDGNGLGRIRFIVRLLFPSRPSAISKSIMKVAINSINSGIFLPKQFTVVFVGFKHILLELFKGIPKILNASSTVILKRFVFRLGTSADNLAVDIIKSLSVHSVFSGSFSKSLGTSATARSRMPIPKIISPSVSGFPALAGTIIKTTPAFAGNEILNYEFPKLLSDKIYSFTHTESIARLRGLVNVGGGDTNKFGGKRVKDAQGVEWIEVPISKEMGEQPVQAFGAAEIGTVSKIAATGIGLASSLILAQKAVEAVKSGASLYSEALKLTNEIGPESVVGARNFDTHFDSIKGLLKDGKSDELNAYIETQKSKL